MAFLEDPRLRQRWNQIAHDAETVTENAAAGIWSIQHHYINPCLGSVASSIERCTAVCFGSADERRRRRRERLHGEGAEYSFDFYDDWNDDDTGWATQDWDRLLAGTGSSSTSKGRRKHGGGGGGGGGGDVTDQPRRKRAMSYGTRRRSDDGDPTIIPSTQPIGFLGRLPWRLGGTLRYRPSAADLQDNPGKQVAAETQPLLGTDDDDNDDDNDDDDVNDNNNDNEEEDDDDDKVKKHRRLRRRSGTDGSGDTSDSFRSRGDIFPSDGEGDEDAIPLDDDVTFDMVRPDDRSSSARTSSKGKRPDDGSRTVSRTTLRSENEAEEVLERATFQAARLPRFG